jgi:aminomethyltransferase
VEPPLKRTPLYDAHVKAGARMVPFGGWEMPVQYRGIIEEHRTVRAAVGLFDVSHMGEFEVEGPEALAALQWITTNDVAALEVGQVQYSLLAYPHGGIVDDLTVYRLAGDRYMVTVNAANIDKDWGWVSERSAELRRARWTNISASTALIAVQGPGAEALVGRLADRDVTPIGYYRFVPGAVAGLRTLISRTGYTGEDGFELYVDAADAERLWRALLETGAPDGAAPIGLGARDTLRLEMGYALYGNDIDETTNPLEAGLGWIVKPAKGDFVGRAAIEKARADGLRRRLVGLEMAERAVPRHGYAVLAGGARVGVVTSGSYGPSVDRSIALAYVDAAHATVGTDVLVEIRGQGKSARIVRPPFHPARVKKQRSPGG